MPFFLTEEGTFLTLTSNIFDYSGTILLCTESVRGCRIMSGARWAKPGAIGNGSQGARAFKTKQVPAGITAVYEALGYRSKGLVQAQ